MSEAVEIECECSRTTESAILIENLKGVNIWIPKSQISDYSTEDGKDILDIGFSPTLIFIPEWLAEKSDLI